MGVSKKKKKVALIYIAYDVDVERCADEDLQPFMGLPTTAHEKMPAALEASGNLCHQGASVYIV